MSLKPSPPSAPATRGSMACRTLRSAGCTICGRRKRRAPDGWSQLRHASPNLFHGRRPPPATGRNFKQERNERPRLHLPAVARSRSSQRGDGGRHFNHGRSIRRPRKHIMNDDIKKEIENGLTQQLGDWFRERDAKRRKNASDGGNTPPLYDNTTQPWEQLNQWALNHVMGWHASVEWGMMSGATEIETLRMVAASMLRERCVLLNRLQKQAAQTVRLAELPATSPA